MYGGRPSRRREWHRRSHRPGPSGRGASQTRSRPCYLSAPAPACAARSERPLRGTACSRGRSHACVREEISTRVGTDCCSPLLARAGSGGGKRYNADIHRRGISPDARSYSLTPMAGCSGSAVPWARGPYEGRKAHGYRMQNGSCRDECAWVRREGTRDRRAATSLPGCGIRAAPARNSGQHTGASAYAPSGSALVILPRITAIWDSSRPYMSYTMSFISTTR